MVGAHINWGSLVNSEHKTLHFLHSIELFDVQICAFFASDYGDVSIYVKKNKIQAPGDNSKYNETQCR